VSVAAIRAALARVMPNLRMIELSAKRGAGVDAWIAWLEAERTATLAEPHHDHTHPH
jgi:Ni2+-binding GTPase involved in maturation of urease and hydrogenase